MKQQLSQKTCVPCRGGIPPLSAANVSEHLLQTAGWQARDDYTKLEANFQFKNFRTALEFVRQVGELAEDEFHHPISITFGWGFARIVLQTKKITVCMKMISSLPPRSMTSPRRFRDIRNADDDWTSGERR